MRDDTVPWLAEAGTDFPDIAAAQCFRDGLVAAGGDLSVPRLLAAYRAGIFPWFEAGGPILWWAFARRTILYTEELKISRSMQKVLRNRPYRVTANSAFGEVLEACAHTPRNGQDGTWLTPEMRSAYEALYRAGHACSFEYRDKDDAGNLRLSGGLYGTLIGRMFFGESMFSRTNDASKTAFVHAVRFLQERGVTMIDCQVPTRHLISLGAREIGFADFRRHLDGFCNLPAIEIPESYVLYDGYTKAVR